MEDVIQTSNSVLKAAEQKIESQLTPKNRGDYMKIVVAGMRAAMQGGSDSIIAKIRDSKDPLRDCALGAVNLSFVLRRMSRGTMPIQAQIPAAMTLMLHALDVVDKLGMMKIGNPELDQATKYFTDFIYERLGISAQMLHNAANRVHGLMQDPVAMEKIKRAAGVVKDPRASTPTELPPAEAQ